MRNPKVFFLSLIALVFVALGIFVDWYFLIVSIILMIVNQRELMKKSSKN